MEDQAKTRIADLELKNFLAIQNLRQREQQKAREEAEKSLEQACKLFAAGQEYLREAQKTLFATNEQVLGYGKGMKYYDLVFSLAKYSGILSVKTT